MNGPTLLFVHGTGIRGGSYSATFETIKQKVAEHDLALEVRGCFWGESQGARLRVEGRSIPEYLEAGGGKEPTAAEQQLALLVVLYTDPWYELAPARLHGYLAGATRRAAAALLLRQSVETFTVSDDLAAQLATEYRDVLRRRARRLSPGRLVLHPGSGHRSCSALAAPSGSCSGPRRMDPRGASSDAGYPAVSGTVRDAIVESVTAELHGHGMGISDFLTRPFKGMALKYVTHRLTSDRGELTDRITDPGGDIMRFLARGDNAREFLKQAIADCEERCRSCSGTHWAASCVLTSSSPSTCLRSSVS